MNGLKQFWASLFLSRRFFHSIAALSILFLLAHFLSGLGPFARIGLWSLVLLIFLDFWALYGVGEGLYGFRTIPDRLSIGDKNPIEASIFSKYRFPIDVRLIDELPAQLQVREGGMHKRLQPGGQHSYQYDVRPVTRGLYGFGRLNVFVSSPLGLWERRYLLAEPVDVPVYPSFLQMRRYELLAASNRLHEAGVKRIRRVGQAMEFEHIREYVVGDDPRRVNWRATANRGELMVNHFQDERAQPLYCLIDMGRVMKMPFDGMTLLDYSINASLVLANVSLTRKDRAGLLTFSHNPGSFVRAEKGVRQLGVLLDRLYALTTDFKETDFGNLYTMVRRRIQRRSLLVLFTNFESMTALVRQLPYLRALNRVHLLVVVFFENTELDLVRHQEAVDTESIYIRTIAEQFAREKEEIARELNRFGIQTILSAPRHLSVNTLNKYLELKARGMF